MIDIGDLHHFLGITITRSTTSLFLSQATYATELLDRVVMASCKLASNPIDTSPKLRATARAPIDDPTAYCSIGGAL